MVAIWVFDNETVDFKMCLMHYFWKMHAFFLVILGNEN